MQKWEYSAVGQLLGDTLLTSFTKSGQKITEIKEDKKAKISSDDMLARLIAQLGREGWEMVGSGNVADVRHMIYFKRPLP